MKRDGDCASLWQETVDQPKPFNSFSGGEFDVVIAGGGITGITTGLLLQKAGKSVLIAEAQSIGFGTTGGTTAHLNTFLDTTYQQIEKNFDQESVVLVAKAIRQALDLIKTNIETYQIDCGYKQLPGYVYAEGEKQTKELSDMYTSAKKVHVDVDYVNVLPIDAAFDSALVFNDQAQFHPLRYLTALAGAFVKAGGVILESCRVLLVDEGESLNISTSLGHLVADKLIYATHIPPGVNLLHFRCAPYRSYAMSVRLQSEDDYPDALIYTMEDTYHYMRTQEIDGRKFLIAGGEDHKTGHEENTSHCFRNLENFVRKHFAVESIINQWSSQYFESVDGLPYVGYLPGSGDADNLLVATGFGGNGMMHSAISAILLTDLIMRGESEYAELLDPSRIKMIAGFSSFVKEAADVVGHLAESLFPAEKITELSDLAHGEAKVVRYEGRKIALYKDEAGEIHALHAACTHIKCDVAWNAAEKSWDCPCHGSRFNIDGEVLTAPARKDLQKIILK